jgi:hypothetical protein
MAITTAYFAQDLGQMIADLPAICTYGGRTFNVSVSDLSRQESLSLTGQIENIDIRVEILNSDVAGLAEIKADTRLAIKRPGEATASNYKVVSTIKPADNVGLACICAADRRNI